MAPYAVLVLADTSSVHSPAVPTRIPCWFAKTLKASGRGSSPPLDVQVTAASYGDTEVALAVTSQQDPANSR